MRPDGKRTAEPGMLGVFLRERRGRITLEQARLPSRSRSRRGTLTQEDLARLTGYSVRTISALEQGVEHRPTPELLDAIATALALGSDDRHVLWYLATAGQAPLSAAGVSAMDPGLTRLLEVLDAQFAYVTDGVRNVLAQTSTCQKWAGDMIWHPGQRNLAHWVFLSPHAKHVFPFWYREPAASVIANLRGQLARMPADAELNAIIDEVCELSADARRLWSGQDELRFDPSTHVTLRLPGHTDPDQPDDERYHVTATVAQLTPTRPGHEHRFTVFLLPDGDLPPALPAAAECTACARQALPHPADLGAHRSSTPIDTASHAVVPRP